jgi:hypothetical protein
MEGCLGDLYEYSHDLRQQAVALLSQPRKRLFVQGRDYVHSRDLVASAAAQYGMSSEEYCAAMRQESVWGGGPEIVALCNIFKRPIHVYELATRSDTPTTTTRGGTTSPTTESTEGNTFVLRRMACFGSPRYHNREALHILSADSRFPDLEAGEQLASGNHFLALFPTRQRRKRLRGGGEDLSKTSEMDGGTDNENDNDINIYSRRKLFIFNWFRRCL